MRLVLEGNGVFEKRYELFQPIKPDESKFSVLSVKVEVTLRKANGISWASFEKTDGNVVTWTTFGIEVRARAVQSATARGHESASLADTERTPRVSACAVLGTGPGRHGGCEGVQGCGRLAAPGEPEEVAARWQGQLCSTTVHSQLCVDGHRSHPVQSRATRPNDRRGALLHIRLVQIGRLGRVHRGLDRLQRLGRDGGVRVEAGRGHARPKSQPP